MTGGLQRRQRRFQLSLPVRVRPRTGRRERPSSANKPRSTSRASGLRLDRAELPEVENTFTENISTGGCYFRFSKELAVGSKIEMEIEMPGTAAFRDGPKVRFWGKVVRVEHIRRRGRIGIACVFEHYRFLSQPAASDCVPRHSLQQLQG